MTRKDARLRGLDRYVTGKPCKRGHVSERYVSDGNCVECVNVRRWDNREYIKAYNAARYIENRDDVLMSVHRYRAENPDKIREYDLTRAATKKRKATAAKSQRKYLANPEKKAKHQELVKAYRARVAKAVGRHVRSDAVPILEKQKRKCAICFSRLGRAFEVDHIIPLSRGGSNDLTNLQITCRPCNRQKSAIDPFAFAARLGRLL